MDTAVTARRGDRNIVAELHNKSNQDGIIRTTKEVDWRVRELGLDVSLMEIIPSHTL